MNPLSVRHNFSWVLGSNVVYGLYQWLLIAFLAKLLNPAAIGQYSLALATVVPVQMLLNLQLRALQASDTREQFEFSHYLSVRVITTTLIAPLVLLVTLVLPIDNLDPEVLMAIIAIKMAESIADVFYGAFQHAERMDISSKGRLSSSLLALALFTSVLAASSNLPLSLFAICFGHTVVLVGYTVPQLLRYRRDWQISLRLSTDSEQLLVLTRTALPLGIAIAIVSLNDALPRLVLSRFWGDYEVGILAALIQLITAGTIVVGALGQSVTPTLARYAQSNQADRFFRLIHRMVLLALAIGLIAALAVMLIGEWAIETLYTEDFASHTDSLLILAFASGPLFAASFLGYGLTAARIISNQIWIFLGSSAVLLTGLWVLVPSLGVSGAAFGILVTYAIQAITCWLLLKSRFSNMSGAAARDEKAFQ